MRHRKLHRRIQKLQRAIVERLEERRLLSGDGDLIPYDTIEPADPEFPNAQQIVNRWSSTASGAAGANGTSVTLTWVKLSW